RPGLWTASAAAARGEAQGSGGAAKRVRWEEEEVACGTEHTVVYLLLQSGRLSPRGLATLACLCRSFSHEGEEGRGKRGGMERGKGKWEGGKREVRKRVGGTGGGFEVKRVRWEEEEVACGTDHTVVYLLLQSGRLSPRGLATRACLCRSFRHACEDEMLWHLVCIVHWPSLNAPDLEARIRASGGYKRFCRLLHTPCGEVQSTIPAGHVDEFVSDVIFLVDVSYRGSPIFARRISGASDLEHLQQPDSFAFRLPDINVGAVLVDGKPGPSRLVSGLKGPFPILFSPHPIQTTFDSQVGAVLVDGKPGLSRRALERAARELQVSCLALRGRDDCFAVLLNAATSQNSIIGG
ncbi:unnamed protein product, partial [Closterium sp. Naga37s-1]